VKLILLQAITMRFHETWLEKWSNGQAEWPEARNDANENDTSRTLANNGEPWLRVYLVRAARVPPLRFLGKRLN